MIVFPRKVTLFLMTVSLLDVAEIFLVGLVVIVRLRAKTSLDRYWMAAIKSADRSGSFLMNVHTDDKELSPDTLVKSMSTFNEEERKYCESLRQRRRNKRRNSQRNVSTIETKNSKDDTKPAANAGNGMSRRRHIRE